MTSQLRKFTSAVVFCICAVAVIAFFYRETEPRHEGRTLSMWLAVWTHHAGDLEGEKCERAVRAIGTNALPFLLEWIRYESPSWQPKQVLWSVAPRAIRHWSFWQDSAAWRADLAPIGFGILGPTADPAIPGLAFIAYESKDQQAVVRAINALRRIGPTTVPTLIAMVNSTNVNARFFAITALRVFGTNATPALPGLIEGLQDKETSVAIAAAETLLELKLEPKATFVAWTNTLNEPRQPLRLLAVRAIAGFDQQHYPVVPSLVRMLEDGDWLVRTTTFNELSRIAPNVLTNTFSR